MVLVRGNIVISRTLLFSLVFGISMMASAAAKPKHKTTSRTPAAASKTCPDHGCACDELKAFASKCEIATHAQYAQLANLLRNDQDERRKTDLKSCPHQPAAESCRAKSKKTVTQKKSHSSMYKISASQELGNFGIELLENAQKNPRSPASR